MPRYKIKFFREVVTNDEVSRVIEAPDLDAAIEHAQFMASGFDMNCPDDVKTDDGYADCRGWQLDYGTETETDEPADEVVPVEDEDDAEA